MKRCPKCGADSFFVTVHVSQDWCVDGDGGFLECANDCIEITHKPNDDDIWECATCGYNGAGSIFNVKEE